MFKLTEQRTNYCLLLKALICTCLWVSLPSLSVAANKSLPLLEQANLLIKQKRADEAYQLLLPLESQKAGDPAYDYMLGVSAMESGDLSNAVFALQRAVAMKPDFVGAKMDLARTYYKLNEMNEAEQEFHSIFPYGPSVRLTEIINLYLNNIKQRRLNNGNKAQANITLDIGVGYDTNANSAPDMDEYLGFPLDENSRQKASSYLNTITNFNYLLPLNKNQIITFSAGANRRSNDTTEFVNSMSLIASGGYIRKLPEGNLTVIAQLFQAYATDKFSGQNTALIGQYTGPEKKGQSIGGMANISMFRAASESSIRDVNQFVLGININNKTKHAFLPNATLSFSGGKAIPVESGSIYGKDFNSARVMFSKALKIKYKLLLKSSASITNTRYSGKFTDLDRRENLFAYDFSSDISIKKNIKLKLSARHNVNESTIDLYTFSRNEIKTAIQWVFK